MRFLLRLARSAQSARHRTTSSREMTASIDRTGVRWRLPISRA